ncbi:MAG: ATP-binding cassette domain-containing protein [Mediterraneibacter gnavus]
MRERVIETTQITKTYGKVLALDHVDICVKRGDIYGLIGDNGAGKSTLLKLLAGHSAASTGEIRLFGEQGEKELQRARRRSGVMIEQPGFFGNLTVENNMEYYRIQKGVPGKEKVEEMLRMAGIWEKRKCRCKTLSMGMKQRLGLAMAMLGEPELLILDEPINGLDPSGIVEFRQLLKRLNEEKKITILLSSHILTELQQLATVYGFLSKGRLLEQITAETLHERCTDSVEIAVSDVQQYAVFLEEQLSGEGYKVLPDGKIRIVNPKQDIEVYSRTWNFYPGADQKTGISGSVLHESEEGEESGMLNYIKSECYRVIHSRSTYVMTGIMAVLPVLFHIILYVTGVASSTTQDFPYDITSFSFSFLAGSPMLFTYAGLIVAAVLYEDEHKNGNIKNAVAFGISREKLFLGKCMTAVLTATVIMALVLIAYIGSAWFLLEHTGPTSLKIILTEIPAVYGTAVASMILGIALLAYIKNEVMAAMLWAVIVYAIPRVLLMAGMVLLGQWGIEFLWDFAQLLPANLFQFGAKVNMSHCEVLWKTSQGMTKCVIVGIVGTVLAIVAGIVMLRKKEV